MFFIYGGGVKCISRKVSEINAAKQSRLFSLAWRPLRETEFKWSMVRKPRNSKLVSCNFTSGEMNWRKKYLVMNIKPIRTEKDYRAALKRMDEIIALDPKEGTTAFDELDLISTLVESYENIHYHIDARGPVY